MHGDKCLTEGLPGTFCIPLKSGHWILSEGSMFDRLLARIPAFGHFPILGVGVGVVE